MDLDSSALESIGRQIRADVLTTHARDSCIYTSATTINLLRRLGHDAYALAVRTLIVNDAMARIMDERGIENVDKDDPDVLAAGGYGVGIGYTEGEMHGKWPGHLVVICDRRWLLDFSIDQASRPEHSIPLDEPFVGQVDEAVLRGHKIAQYEFHGDGPLMRIEYMPYPKDRTYRDAPDWERGIAREVEVRIER